MHQLSTTTSDEWASDVLDTFSMMYAEQCHKTPTALDTNSVYRKVLEAQAVLKNNGFSKDALSLDLLTKFTSQDIEILHSLVTKVDFMTDSVFLAYSTVSRKCRLL